MFSLKDKTAIITGGGSGIGREISVLFAKQGADVHFLELTDESGAETIREIAESGSKGTAYSCNVASQRQVVKLVEKIGKVNILINNAGIAHIGRADNTSEEDFDKVFQVNVKGAYNCLYAVIPRMKEQGGVIINMASIAVLVGISDRFAYSMSKGAIHAMTLSVARDYLHDRIRCNSISPASVHTPFVDGFIAKN